MLLIPPDKIYLAPSHIPNAGRGVFSREAIKKGEIIERCPTLSIPKYEADSVNQTILVEYVYYLGKNKDQLILVFGYGSIYNHTYTPNAKYKVSKEEDCLEFVALRDIKKDEEVTVNYNQDSQNGIVPMWFEVK